MMSDAPERNEDRKDVREPRDEPRAEPPGGPTGAGLPWVEQRAEIAEEPGNHGRFALGCSVAIAVVLVSFFVLRLFVLR